MLKFYDVYVLDSSDSTYREFTENTVGTLTVDEENGKATFDIGEGRVHRYDLDAYEMDEATVKLRYEGGFVTFHKPNPELYGKDEETVN